MVDSVSLQQVFSSPQQQQPRSYKVRVISSAFSGIEIPTTDGESFTIFGTQSTEDFVRAAVATMQSIRRVPGSYAAILYDAEQSTLTVLGWTSCLVLYAVLSTVRKHHYIDQAVLERLQSRLSRVGVGSFALQLDSTATASNLTSRLRSLVRKRVRRLLLLATPANAIETLRRAADAAVLGQNYFWLLLDGGGLSTGPLAASLAASAGANVALLRGATAECSTACTDLLEVRDGRSLRTLDVQFVKVLEAVSAALNQSLLVPGFQPSNASCLPLQPWSHGSFVMAQLIALRGRTSFNASTRHLDSQGLELVASYNKLKSSPLEFLRSAAFDVSSGELSKLFSYRSEQLVFPNTFLGFKNETITICAPEQVPLTSYVSRSANNTVQIKGFIMDVLNFLAEKMEFRYVTKQPADGEFGAPMLNSTVYSGCVGELQRGAVTLAAGPFTRTTVRERVIDFSVSLFEESTCILLPRPVSAPDLVSVFESFHPYVWLTLVAFVVMSSVIAWCLSYFSPFSAYNLGLQYSIADEVRVQEYLWSIVGSFLQQGQDFFPFAMSARTVMAFWWMFTVIVYSAYTANLTAFLTVLTENLPIRSLEDLLAQSSILPNVVLDSNLYTMFSQAPDGMYKQLAETMVAVPLGHCLDGVSDGRRACINDYSFLLPIANEKCKEYYIAKEHFNTATVAFMYPKDALYADVMDFYLQKLHETGAMQRLFWTYMRSENVTSACASSSKGSAASTASSIGLNHVVGGLVLTGCFYGLGLIILLVEVAWIRLGLSQPKDCVF